MSDTEQLLLRRVADLKAERDRLRLGIQDYLDGNYEPQLTNKHHKCHHDRYGYEGCENCIDEHFQRLLSPHQDRGAKG